MKITDKDRIDFLEALIKNDEDIKIEALGDSVNIFTVPAQHRRSKTVREGLDIVMQYGIDDDWLDEDKSEEQN